MSTAMVLCAGLGTRLSPLTSVLPKALMPVGDRPVLGHALTKLVQAGVTRTVVNSHHLSATLRSALAGLDARAEVVHEPRILGTAGGLRHAAAALGEGIVLIWNGDIWAPEVNLAALWPAFAACAAPWLWVVDHRPAGSGTVGLDECGGVVRLRGERFGREVLGGDFSGVSVMGQGLRERLPEVGCLVGDVALPWLRAGGRIATCPMGERFIDVGTPAELLAANLHWLALRGLTSWCAPDARCAPEVELDGVLIGAGATVGGAGMLSSVVVFPSAELVAPARGVLAAPGARVEVPAGMVAHGARRVPAR